MELYEKIRNIREDKDIKQKDMAAFLYMQPNTYNAYEKGKRTITADLLKNICIYLNISADELLDINIKNPYNSLNSDNAKIVEVVKKGLILLQNSKDDLNYDIFLYHIPKDLLYPYLAHYYQYQHILSLYIFSLLSLGTYLL